MVIQFDVLPDTLRVPFTYVEIGASRASAGTGVQPYRLLLVGQKLAAGAQAALVPVRLFSRSQAQDAFGEGSQLYTMVGIALDQSSLGEVWAVAVADPAGVASTFTLTFTGSPTAAGQVVTYIAGRRIVAAVAAAATPTQVAAAVAAAINLATNVPVTAGAVAGVVTLTVRHVGTIGNDVDVRFNYQEGERTPAGLTAVAAAGVTGTGDPDLSVLWPALGDQQYNVIALGVRDDANLDDADAELNDRFSPIRQVEGHAFYGHPGDHATLLTFGGGRNGKHLTAIPSYAEPTPPWDKAAAVAAVVAREGQKDPGRPHKTLDLKGILPAGVTERFTLLESDALLHEGISTTYVDAGGVVRIQRLVTNYQSDELGNPDVSFLDVTALLTLSYIRWSLRTAIETKYARHKLGIDGKGYGAGQPIVTPLTMKGEIVSLARGWEELALIEGFDEAQVVVERNTKDANRLDIFLNPDLINGLLVVGVKLSFLI